MSARKYRQSGYQDDAASSEGAVSRPGRKAVEGPRGRGLGAPTKSVLKCALCGKRVELALSEETVCRGCGSDLHTCTNCRHFDSSAPNECRESVEVRIAAKAKKNDCGLFQPKLVQEFAPDAGSGGTSQDAKAAFDDLFDF